MRRNLVDSVLTGSWLTSAEAGQQIRQFEQIADAKRRASTGEFHERIGRCKSRPLQGNGRKTTAVVVEIGSLFAPVLPKRDQPQLTSQQRMKRMCHPKSLSRTVAIGCS